MHLQQQMFFRRKAPDRKTRPATAAKLPRPGHSGQDPRATEQAHAAMSLGNAHAKRLPEAIPASLDLPTLQEGCMRAAPGRPKGPEKTGAPSYRSAVQQPHKDGALRNAGKVPATRLKRRTRPFP